MNLEFNEVENKVMNGLVDAWDAFLQTQQEPNIKVESKADQIRDFRFHIHALQRIMYTNLILRNQL